MNTIYKKILDIPYLPMFVRRLIVIGINWTFQGILYMDKTEKIFKILLEVILTMIFWISFSVKLHPAISLVLGFVVAHTTNWLFNNNLFGLFKTFGNVKTPKERFDAYIRRLKKKVENEPSIVWAGIYGSLVRGEFKETSDLDVRLIRKPGFINGVKACIFVMRERIWANFHKFPLDIYVFDSQRSLEEKIRENEKPLIIINLGTPMKTSLGDVENEK